MPTTYDDPRSTWLELLNAKLKAGMPRERAVSSLAREQPELREQMIAADIAQRGRSVSV